MLMMAVTLQKLRACDGSNLTEQTLDGQHVGTGAGLQLEQAQKSLI